MRFLKRPTFSIQAPSVGDSFISIGAEIPQQISSFLSFVANELFVTAVAIIEQSGVGVYNFTVVRDQALSATSVSRITGHVNGASTTVTGYISGGNVVYGNLDATGVAQGVHTDGNGNTIANISTELSGVTLFIQGLSTFIGGVNNIILETGSSGAVEIEADDIIYATPGGTFYSMVNWVPWNPTFTNLTVGNGVLVAEIAKIGQTVLWRMQLVFGTTTAITGSVTMAGFPYTFESANGYNANIPMGHAWYRDDSATTSDPGFLQRGATTSSMVFRVHQVSGTRVTGVAISATVPFIWDDPDVLIAEGQYQTNTA